MNSAARTARAILRERTRDQRATHQAARSLATGTPQPVSTHLIARGLERHLAHRYAGALSRKIGAADAMGTTRIKLRRNSRKTATFDVKLFTSARFVPAAIIYRPAKNKAAAARFAKLAFALAA